jgi:hypothetical protein
MFVVVSIRNNALHETHYMGMDEQQAHKCFLTVCENKFSNLEQYSPEDLTELKLLFQFCNFGEAVQFFGKKEHYVLIFQDGMVAAREDEFLLIDRQRIIESFHGTNGLLYGSYTQDILCLEEDTSLCH